MALDLPEPPRNSQQPHPALCLGLGFGVIVLGAIMVHVIFNVLV